MDNAFTTYASKQKKSWGRAQWWTFEKVELLGILDQRRGISTYGAEKPKSIWDDFDCSLNILLLDSPTREVSYVLIGDLIGLTL